MLSMLLLLAAAPQAVEASRPTLRPATILEMVEAGVVPPMPSPGGGNNVNMPVLGQPPAGCTMASTPAVDPNPGNGLLWREGQDRVGHYLLLDRYVGGCPDPMYARYSVPGSNAVGREAMRSTAPATVIIRP